MTVRSFGHVDGTEVLEATIASDAGLEVRIIGWGAAIRDLRLPTRDAPLGVVLGLDTLEAYRAHSPHFGAVPGRYANRIAGASFRLDGQRHDLVANEGPNSLHGGPGGFGRRPWSLLGCDGRRAHFGLVSEAGDLGYPGRLVATASYAVREPATLVIELSATSDAPTPVNLTTHSYFNLDGSGDVRDHRLRVAAEFYTPTGPDGIPTGEIASVAGTRFDFRAPRPLRIGEAYAPYDVNFVLARDRDRGAPLALGATLASERSGLGLALWTSEPGLQTYDGYKLALPVAGHGGRRYGAHAGLALEPQRFPDGPNRPHFPPCIVRPGEVSRQVTELRFTCPDG